MYHLVLHPPWGMKEKEKVAQIWEIIFLNEIFDIICQKECIVSKQCCNRNNFALVLSASFVAMVTITVCNEFHQVGL